MLPELRFISRTRIVAVVGFQNKLNVVAVTARRTILADKIVISELRIIPVEKRNYQTIRCFRTYLHDNQTSSTRFRSNRTERTASSVSCAQHVLPFVFYYLVIIQFTLGLVDHSDCLLLVTMSCDADKVTSFVALTIALPFPKSYQSRRPSGG